MKQLKIVLLLSMLTIINSCTDSDKDRTGPDSYQYSLFLSIQDALGNDFVKGIGYDWWVSDNGEYSDEGIGGLIKPDLYTLEMVYPKKEMDPVWTYKDMISRGYRLDPGGGNYCLGVDLDLMETGYDYLIFYPNASGRWYFDKNLPPANKIIYKLSCPYIFGDDNVHEIITYWKPYNEVGLHQSCYHIKFEGKDYKVEIPSYDELPMATIVWESK